VCNRDLICAPTVPGVCKDFAGFGDRPLILLEKIAPKKCDSPTAGPGQREMKTG
jgi:hypothetical protein